MIGACATIGPSNVAARIWAKLRASAQSSAARSFSKRKARLGCISRGSRLAPPAPLPASRLAHRLGMRLGLLLLHRAVRRRRFGERHGVAEHLVEAEMLQALGEMRG